jgi:hypothetical protein
VKDRKRGSTRLASLYCTGGVSTTPCLLTCPKSASRQTCRTLPFISLHSMSARTSSSICSSSLRSCLAASGLRPQLRNAPANSTVRQTNQRNQLLP